MLVSIQEFQPVIIVFVNRFSINKVGNTANGSVPDHHLVELIRDLSRLWVQGGSPISRIKPGCEQCAEK